MSNTKFHVKVKRKITEKTGSKRLDEMVQELINGAIGSHQTTNNWTATAIIDYVPKPSQVTNAKGVVVNGYEFSADVTFEKVAGSFSDDIIAKDQEFILANLYKTCNSKILFVSYPWAIYDTNDQEIVPQPVVVSNNNEMSTLIDFEKTVTWAELEHSDQSIRDEIAKLIDMDDSDIEAYFSDTIFDRGPHIRIILSHIKRGLDTCGMSRHHVILWGEPGSGKTLCIDKVKELLPEGSYFALNADSATKAGLQKNFLEQFELLGGVPPILFLEEMDKSPENVYNPFLSLLDTRGMVEKNTARMQKRVRANVLAIGTVNDMEKFKGMLGGALASRFCEKLYVPLPEFPIIEKILHKEISENGGDYKWVRKAIDLAKELNIRDPRTVKGFLCGGHRLINGSYQKDKQLLYKAEQCQKSSSLS